MPDKRIPKQLMYDELCKAVVTGEMKERVNVTKVLRGSTIQDVPVAAGIELDCMEFKAEGKDEDGRKSADFKHPSRRIHSRNSDIRMENGKPSSVQAENQKVAPKDSNPHQSASGRTTLSAMGHQHGLVNPLQQQRSEIFVFSTRLANEAAESVRQGHCKSMIQFHTEHPNTRAMMQKNQLNSNDMVCDISAGVLGDMACQPNPGTIRMIGHSPHTWAAQQPIPKKGIMGSEGMMTNGAYHPGSPEPIMMAFWPDQGCAGADFHAQIGPNGYHFGRIMDIENELLLGAHKSLPDGDSLTLEQRQHRSQSLAQLTKIHKMLLGGSSQQGTRQPPPAHNSHHTGLSRCPATMSSQLQGMVSPHGMISQEGMMLPHGMMSHQHMISQQAVSPYVSRGSPQLGPSRMNYKEQQAPHDWYKAQHDYFLDRQHRMMNRMPYTEAGPQRSYFTSVLQKDECGGSPPAADMRMPGPSHGSVGLGLDPDVMGMFGCPEDVSRPTHLMEPMLGMISYPAHMPNRGSIDPGFYPSPIVEAVPSGLGSGPPQRHSPIQIMDSSGVPGMKDLHRVILHRAGNPEQFNPETMGGVVPQIQAPSSSKHSPNYAHTQKRKRCSDMDNSYTKGHLQQTPSPTKIHYHLNQFEGQELMITKQLNAAYVTNDRGEDVSTTLNFDDTCGSVSAGSGGHFRADASSPLHRPGSNKFSDPSQIPTHMVSSPTMSTVGLPLYQGPANSHTSPPLLSGQPSGANMRLSHFDPVPVPSGTTSGSHTPTPKSSSSMANITSASLVNLAKGVENLSNQMQQNMMQGGPFHSIQVQGHITSTNNISNNNSNNGSPTTSTTTTTSLSSPSVSSSFSQMVTTAKQSTMSGHHPINSYSNMQSVNSEPVNMVVCGMAQNHSPHMDSGMMGAGPEMMGGGPEIIRVGSEMMRAGPEMMGECPLSEISNHLVQAQTIINSEEPVLSPVLSQGPSMPADPPIATSSPCIPPHRAHSSSSMLAIMSNGQFTSPPLLHPHMSSSLHDVTSPPFPTTSSSNSSVQIQQKGHNTIQYLPAHPPSKQMPTTKLQADLDYPRSRFSSPLHPMDAKTESSLLQYLPNSPPPALRPQQMSSELSAGVAKGQVFENQVTTAIHHSASMMRSCSIPDLQSQVMHRTGLGMHPTSVEFMRSSPMMGTPDSLAVMANFSHMRQSYSPGTSHPLNLGHGPGNLECVSPIPRLDGYLRSVPSMDQTQYQAQAQAAIMMQGNSHLPASPPHGPMPPCGGPSPHIPLGPMLSCRGPSPHSASMMPISGTSVQEPIPLGGMLGPSVHELQMLGQSHEPANHGQSPHISPNHGQPLHGPPILGHSPHGPQMTGHFPHGPPMPGKSPHGSQMCGQSPHVSMPSSIPGLLSHGCQMPGQSPHGPQMPGQSLHMSMSSSIPGLSSHGLPIPGTIPGLSLHGHMSSPLAHSSMMGPMSPHGHMGHMFSPLAHSSMMGHMGHMHRQSMPPASMPRLSGMGFMSPPAIPGQFGIHYPGYQQDYLPSGSPHYMMPAIMGGLPQPYRMMSSLQGPG